MSKKTILIVDDDKMILGVTKRLLERLGYQVYTTTKGEEALDFLLNTHFNLIISDFDMPEMNGPKLWKKIREINLSIPIIVSSGGSHEEEINFYLNQEIIQEILPKPYMLKDMREILSKTLH